MRLLLWWLAILATYRRLYIISWRNGVNVFLKYNYVVALFKECHPSKSAIIQAAKCHSNDESTRWRMILLEKKRVITVTLTFNNP